MRYTREWEDLTDQMGYWINMEDAYITYDNRYIETLWYLLKELYQKELLYTGYTIQPYSPAAGTGLSSHELNQPGCYRDVKDTTIVALFKIIRDDKSEFLFKDSDIDTHILAWTTTPWTLPSNTALAMGSKIDYALVSTFNPYSGDPIRVILAKSLLEEYFPAKNKELSFYDYKPGNNDIPYQIISECKGKEFEGIAYEQLIDWVQPENEAFKVLLGDFVTTEEGTGIVHIAPTFGADDYNIARKYGIPPLIIVDRNNNQQPLVDRKGRFYRLEDIDPGFLKANVNKETYTEFSGRFVKNEYIDDLPEDAESTDVSIAVSLKKQKKVFRIAKYVHNYPHCWRTDKPILYYPMEAWFIRTTALKDKLIELNNTINWKPPSTGSGRFGQWLENLVDWNLSRSRFWGTPLPIWITEDKKEQLCIGSVEELKTGIEKSIEAGFMKENPLKQYTPGDNSSDNYNQFDLHRPFVDEIILCSPSGKKMFREPDLIDVWFDSGAMPYAQWHYPFEHKIEFGDLFPADFISEGVDQTRGWFFTLHAIAAMISGSVAYRNIISHGLILDKSGNKMSKRLSNTIDPIDAMKRNGADPVRWYLITNSQPWDNRKFDIEAIDELKRKFFGTLFNTYSFFSLYANIDGFDNSQDPVPFEKRPEIDRWIISLLNSLVSDVEEFYEDYEPTKAGRAIQDFIVENLSNWYVRLNRKRYWGGEFTEDKLSAYQILYTCLETISLLIAPLIPFYAEHLFSDLNGRTGSFSEDSVHHVDFPKADKSLIDQKLEERMAIAQKISSMVLGLRRKVNIKVRQPLNKLIIPVPDKSFRKKVEAVENLVLAEINVKEIEYLTNSSDMLVKKIKPNFKSLGPRFGKMMKPIVSAIGELTPDDISRFEQEGTYIIQVEDQKVKLGIEDVEIVSEDIPGWLVANEGIFTIALDITITEELRQEGIAREFVNRIQNFRKESGFDVVDKIEIEIQEHDAINDSILKHKDYICTQTLADSISLVKKLKETGTKKIELDENIETLLKIMKISD